MRASLLVLVLLLYAGTLDFPLVFDDQATPFTDPATLDTLAVQSWPGFFRGLSTATFIWTYRAVGWHIELFRLGNVLLHFFTAFLLFGFLRRLFTQNSGVNSEPNVRFDWIAFAGSAWFAIHPVTVYATAYLSQRSVLMATLFSLAALDFWLRGLLTAGRSRPCWLTLAVVCYALAILSKEHAVMLPAVAVAMTVLVRPATAVELRPLILPGLALIILAALAAIQSGYVVGRLYEGHAPVLLLMQSQLAGRSLVEHAHFYSILTQGSLFFNYLLIWLLPFPGWISVDMHPPLALSWLSWPQTVGFLLFMIWPIAAVTLLRVRGRLGLAGFALLGPWLLFLTEMATVRVQEIFVLYRSYLWMAVLPALLPLLLGNLPLRVLRFLVLAVVVALAPLTLNRLDSFSSSLKLWDDAVRKTEDRRYSFGGRAWAYRGAALIDAGNDDAALRDFARALELDPWFAETYGNRAVIYMHRGMWREALADCDAALARSPGLEYVKQNRDKILRIQKTETVK